MAKTYSLGIHVVWLAASQFHGGVVGADVAADVDGVGVDDGLGEERGLEAFVGVDGGFGGHHKGNYNEEALIRVCIEWMKSECLTDVCC